MQKNKRFGIRLSEESYNKLMAICKTRGLKGRGKISEGVRHLIDRYQVRVK